MKELILTCNAGSNSLKCALYKRDGKSLCYRFDADRIHDETIVTIKDRKEKTVLQDTLVESGYENALSFFLHWYEEREGAFKLAGAGHRVVHGGDKFSAPVRISPEVKEALAALRSFAPTHQPHNLDLIDILAGKYEDLQQVACFDTAFHSSQPWEAQQFALPHDLVRENGLYRYGFHGLSYDYIAGILPDYIPGMPAKKVILAHLGSGASLCALKDGQSAGTTMGLTALDGLMMGRRCGTLDPGVILYLLQEKEMSTADIERLLYKESGLKGVSGISADMRDLYNRSDEKAQQAVTLFCYMAARQMGGLIMALGGLDGLVFTGGMGCNSPEIREKICDYLAWLSVDLDEEANKENAMHLSHAESAIDVLALPTDEESVIARYTSELII